MGDTIPGFVVFIGGLVFAALIVSVGFYIYNNQKETSNAVVEQTNRLNNQLREAEWTQYDWAEVTGSEIMSVIKRMKDTGTWVYCMGNQFYYDGAASNTTGTGGTLGAEIDDATMAETIKKARKRGDPNYINPSSIFTGVVVRDDATGAIVGIAFNSKAEYSGTP